MAKPTDEEILIRAYEIWEKNGKPDDREDEFYNQAQKELGDSSVETAETFLE
jgi:outer membrane protein assembly factor BamD (BamD/ComL family)